MSDYGPCPVCGAVSDNLLTPVWEHPDTHDQQPPDWIGCLECGTMTGYDGDRTDE
jgi:hypothetical protein